MDWKDLMEASDLIADAIIKRTNPVQDDLSRNQAEKLYGAQWMRQVIEEGRIRGTRTGSGTTSKVIFSRHELDCLRAEQRQKARLILETK